MQIEYTQRRATLEPIVNQLMNDPLFPRYPDALSLWYNLQDGILPHAGGWLDQPAWYTDDMNAISLIAEYESLPDRMKQNAKRIQDVLERVRK